MVDFADPLPPGPGMGGAIFGSWSLSYGVRGHVITVNVNGDWGDPLGALIDLVDAEFRA